jgi:hypothetical protein
MSFKIYGIDADYPLIHPESHASAGGCLMDDYSERSDQGDPAVVILLWGYAMIQTDSDQNGYLLVFLRP